MSLRSLLALTTLLATATSLALKQPQGHIIPTPIADLTKMCTPSSNADDITLGAFMAPIEVGTTSNGDIDVYLLDNNCENLAGSPFKNLGTDASKMAPLDSSALQWGVDITEYSPPYDQAASDWVLNAKYAAQFVYPSDGHLDGCTAPYKQQGPQLAYWVTIGCPLKR